MTLCMIVAMTDERVIGRNNTLPWHFSEDLKRFKALTMGHPIIMGRKTFESIGKPLPGRQNIVVSRNAALRIPGVTMAGSLEKALGLCEDKSLQFVIGGAELFREALPKTERLYLTLIHEKIPGDTFFPSENVLESFKVLEKTSGLSEGKEKLRYSFVTAERI